MHLLAQALDRTVLLMRDELRAEVGDMALIDALISTEIVLVADRANLTSHSAQTAFVTAALLMARSGHMVHLVAPDVALVGAQPPLPPGGIIAALLTVGQLLLPGISFSAGNPNYPIDLELRLGDTRSLGGAKRSIALSARRWSGQIGLVGARWPTLHWTIGALVAAALGAGEAFKAAMWKLERFALNRANFQSRFALNDTVEFELGPEDTAEVAHLGCFDIISAGAIANGLLYCLGRLDGVTGSGRVIDFDHGDLSNLNRNMLLLANRVRELKVEVLTGSFRDALILQALPVRYDDFTAAWIGALAPHVLVGVDDIATRWTVQAQWPIWLGIGATSHWSAMASFHTRNLACARCQHPVNDGLDTPIPTVAFVSFWAGLLLATYLLRSLVAGDRHGLAQQTYITPLRPERPWRTPIARRPNCPLCLRRSRRRAIG